MLKLIYYNLKLIIREKEILFWNGIFTILLSTMFALAFSNILDYEKMEPVTMALVEEGDIKENSQILKEVLDTLEQEGYIKVTKVTGEAEAQNLLDEKTVEAYMEYKDELKITVKESGYATTFLKSVFDNFVQKQATYEHMAEQLKRPLTEEEIMRLMGTESYVTKMESNHAEPDMLLNYFFTVIAMGCLYGGLNGIRIVKNIQGNQSGVAVRNSLSPMPKYKLFLPAFLANFIVQYGLITILVLYMKYLLKVEFGNHMAMVFLINGVGVFLGLSLGILVGAVSSSNENVKQWIVMGITMLGCYLAGMMDSSMKYKVQENAPFLGYINPSNLLTDAYYSLYYYPDMKRTMTNLAIMCGFSILFCVTGVIALRRQQYESI